MYLHFARTSATFKNNLKFRYKIKKNGKSFSLRLRAYLKFRYKIKIKQKKSFIKVEGLVAVALASWPRWSV